MRGRKPKPAALKELEGNPGHRPLDDIGLALPSTLPRCPKHLTGEARREWRRVTKELAESNLLAGVDRAALAAYCQTWSRWVQAEEQLANDELVKTTDKGYEYPNPWLGIANTALDQMRKFLVEFGMTPSSRSRVKVDKPVEDNPFVKYLNSRNGR